MLRRSVEYTFAHRDGEPPVRAGARAGDGRGGDVQAHRPLRERSIRLTSAKMERSAIELLFDKAAASGLIPSIRESLFLPAAQRA